MYGGLNYLSYDVCAVFMTNSKCANTCALGEKNVHINDIDAYGRLKLARDWLQHMFVIGCSTCL